MTDIHLAYFLALGATLSFSSASLVFTQFTRKYGTLWVNTLKAGVAFFFCLITAPWWLSQAAFSLQSFGALGLSGLLGLCLGDIFLLVAFTELGVARTMIVFGFQPLFIGTASSLFLKQHFAPLQLFAILFLFLCLFTFAYEGFQKDGRWKIRGLCFALAGVALDATGVMLSRFGYDHSPDISALHGHLVRCGFALVGFFLVSRFRPFPFSGPFQELNFRQILCILAACFLGTFFSLFLYLNAVRIGHLASLSGIAITGPLFAALFESLWTRTWPRWTLLVAFGFFFVGFAILMTT
jgi:drug/metabolite transporter (DMT)-like permease